MCAILIQYIVVGLVLGCTGNVVLLLIIHVTLGIYCPTVTTCVPLCSTVFVKASSTLRRCAAFALYCLTSSVVTSAIFFRSGLLIKL